jgi:CheY-like chemotaxis protein
VPKILVVDDIEFNIIPIRLMIKNNFNLDIVDAANGEIALHLFREEFNKNCGCVNRAFKLIIMDLQMPVMDGIESSK